MNLNYLSGLRNLTDLSKKTAPNFGAVFRYKKTIRIKSTGLKVVQVNSLKIPVIDLNQKRPDRPKKNGSEIQAVFRN